MSAKLSVDQFRAKIEGLKAVCQMCGFKGHSLIEHLKIAHDKTAGQYQSAFPQDQVEMRLSSRIVTELLKQFNRSPYASDDLDEIAKDFAFSAVTDEVFKALNTKLPVWTDCPQAAVPEMDKDYVFDDFAVRAAMAGLAMNKNVYAQGPTGCGKTELYLQMHARMGRPCIRINMNGDVTVANFIGEMRADPTKGTYFQEGFLPIAMRNGVTLILDEIDYCPPHIGAVLNPILERKKPLYIPDTGQIVQPHPGFRVMATGNTGGKGDSVGAYTGTEMLNSAFLDRFGIKLTMDYLPVDKELAMMKARFPLLDPIEMSNLIRVAVEMRNGFKQGTLTMTLSTRKIIDWGHLRPVFSKTEALQLVLLNWLDQDDTAVVLGITTRVGF